MSKLITPEMILSWNCCEDYTEEILQKLCGDKEGLTALEILDLEIVSNDKLWVLLRPNILSDKILRLFAADCAENVLHLFEEKYPDDKRPRLAIEATRKFAHGKITKEELKKKQAAAREASWSASWSAACAASWAAVRAAAMAAACAAADAACEAVNTVNAACAIGTAADAAERQWQVKRLRELILEMPEEVL